MQKIKILIIYSLKDSLSKDRWDTVTKSPQTEQFMLSQCFALATDKEKLKDSRLENRLLKAIEANSPEILLLHTGLAYSRFPEIFLTVLHQIKQKNPNLRLGFESWGNRGPEINLCKTSDLFDRSSEMRYIEDLIFFQARFGYQV